MEIRKANNLDIDNIEIIYNRIHDNEEKGLTTIGWIRNVYPTRQTAIDAIKRNDMFVIEDNNCIKAVAIINQIQVSEYINAKWNYDVLNEQVLVLHGLVVDPLEKSKGLGRTFISFYEKYAKKLGCKALRMDTNVTNTRARKLYKSLGYKEIDIVSCTFNGIPNVQLVCLEKYLD